MKSKFSSNLIYVSGVISYSFNQWLVLTLISRYISIDAGGQYAYYFALFTPLFIFFSFGVRNAIATDKNSVFENNTYIAVQLVGFLGFSIISTCILYYKGFDIIGILVFLIKGFDLLSELPYGDWIRRKQAYKYGISRLLKSLIFIIFILLTYKMIGYNEYIFFVYPLSILLVYIFYDLKCEVYKRAKKATNDEVKALIFASVPLAVGSLIVSLSSVIPRFLLEIFSSYESVGVYSIAVYIYSMAAIPLTVMMQLIIPKINEISFVKTLKAIRALIVVYAIVLSVFVFLGINPMMEFIYNSDYKFNDIQLFYLTTFGFFQLLLVYYNTIMIGKRQFKKFGKVNLLILIINVLLSSFSISTFDVSGAFFSTMIVSIVSVVFVNLSLRKNNMDKRNDKLNKV